MPLDATSTFERPLTLRERRRFIQDKIKNRSSGDLTPKTISNFLHDALQGIHETLKTVTGEQLRKHPGGGEDYLPLNHLQAQTIARQCVSVAGIIVDNRRLRAGLLERTDFTKGETPALETSLAGGLVRYLAKPAGHDEITRNNYVLLMDFLEHVAKTEVAGSFRLPSDVAIEIAEGIKSNEGASRTNSRQTWQLVQRRYASLVEKEHTWRPRPLLVPEARLAHGLKSEPTTPQSNAQTARAEYPYYQGSLMTAQGVEQKIAALMQSRESLVHAGPLAAAVAQFPQAAGLMKQNAEVVRRLIEAVRDERDKPLGPQLVDSLMQYAQVVRGQGFVCAGIEPHDIRRVMTALPYEQVQKLSTSLGDIDKYRKAIPEAMQARQIAELKREIGHILHTDVRRGGQRIIDLLELTKNTRLQRKVLRGTLLQQVITAVLIPVRTNPGAAYDNLDRLVTMAGSNLHQASFTQHEISGFTAHATTHGWKKSLAIMEGFTKRSSALNRALEKGQRMAGVPLPGFPRRSRVSRPHELLFPSNYFGAIDACRVLAARTQAEPERKTTELVAKKTQPNDGWKNLQTNINLGTERAQLLELLNRPQGYLDAIKLCEAAPPDRCDCILNRDIVTRTVVALFRDAKNQPDRAFTALRRFIPIAESELPFIGLSRRKIETFAAHAKQSGWTEVENLVASLLRRAPIMPTMMHGTVSKTIASAQPRQPAIAQSTPKPPKPIKKIKPLIMPVVSRAVPPTTGQYLGTQKPSSASTVTKHTRKVWQAGFKSRARTDTRIEPT